MASSLGSRTTWAFAEGLVALYAVLAVVERIAPSNGIDRSVADWVSDWDSPGANRGLLDDSSSQVRPHSAAARH